MVLDWVIKSVVDITKMNRSYLTYLTDRNPFRFFTNIFRSYKKSPDIIKRNQSVPTVTQQTSETCATNKPKSEINLSSCQKDKKIEQWTNCKFDDGASQDSLNLSTSNQRMTGASSNISLKKTSCQLDLNIQEKLSNIPLQAVEVKQSSSLKIPLKRAYPWQNFNLDGARKPRYQEIKEVSDMRDEIINLRKSILKRPDTKPGGDRKSPSKEVKFNKMASMLIYPKNKYNVMRQARISLSTNANPGEKAAAANRKKKVPVIQVNKVNGVKTYCPCSYKKNVNKVRKCLPTEHGHFWHLSNAKKQKIF